jgi:predicted hotdog family 3-hydroxylacyl-ACP dehydratase
VSLPLYPIASVVPQRPPMILIDDMLARAEGRITTSVTVRRDGLFFHPGRGVPSHVALEWMAQTCAAYAGADAREAGGAVRIGFLLGSRDFRTTRTWFGEGERFEIEARLEYHDNELGNFACQVMADGSPVVTARLTVFHPDDAAAVIDSQAGER